MESRTHEITEEVLPFVELRTRLAGSFDVDPERLTASARLIEDLGFDSLAVAEVAMVLGELGFEVPVERVHQIRTLGDLCAAARRFAS